MANSATMDRGSLLLIDDHERLRSLMVSIITTMLSVDVHQAGDIPEALALLRTVSVDAIITDLNLPSGPALEAVPTLRRASPNAALVLMSAAPAPGVERAALNAGADAFVSKSAGVEVLCQAAYPQWHPPARPRRQQGGRYGHP